MRLVCVQRVNASELRTSGGDFIMEEQPGAGQTGGISRGRADRVKESNRGIITELSVEMSLLRGVHTMMSRWPR